MATHRLPLFAAFVAVMLWPLPGLARDRVPVPSSAAQRASIQRVRDIFRDDFAKAKTPEQQAILARELIGHSRETSDASDACALLQIARETAAEVGDVASASDAIAEFAARFDVSADALLTDTLTTMASKAPAQSLGPVVDGLIAAAAKSAGSGDRDAAESLLKSAVAAARKARDKTRQDAAVAELKRVRELEKVADKIAPLEKRLQANPSDREAATLLGKHRCFVEGDWEGGLPLLARGDDPALAGLATAELRPSGDIIALGDAWWKYAESLKGQERGPAMTRAVGHYRTGLERLSGLEKVRIEKQLAAAEQVIATMPAGQASTRPGHAAFWLDAAAAGTVLNLEGKPIRSAGASPEAVGEWRDPTVRSLIAVPPAPGAAPTFTPGAIGGNPGLAFTGKELLTVKGPVPRSGVLLLVAQTASPGVSGCLLGSATASPMVDLWTRQDQAIWFTVYPRSAEMKRMNTNAGVLRAGQPFLLTVVWPKPFEIRVNGKQLVNRSDIPEDILGAGQFVIGAADAGGRYPFAGFLGEIMMLDAIPGPDELSRLETALIQKWRIRP
jgi:hypothetical protein